ncbi:MAG TPA: sigma factor-like helix-turn-helix DNA-binding protein, partial [Pedobacter sp.]|nr:sigma factor-like helix-turn-helix DNA-binding protein [Pedobacter sp.]
TDVLNLIQILEESAEERMLREQTHVDLRTMIQLLPDEQKEVLIMRHYADLSFKEIADLTDVSINTALGRMRYALSNLRKMMKVKEVTYKGD